MVLAKPSLQILHYQMHFKLSESYFIADISPNLLILDYTATMKALVRVAISTFQTAEIMDFKELEIPHLSYA